MATTTGRFSLPAELRNRIYEHVLLADQIIKVQTYGPSMIPDLLQVNKQLRKEAGRAFCFGNEFEFVVKIEHVGRLSRLMLPVLRKVMFAGTWRMTVRRGGGDDDNEGWRQDEQDRIPMAAAGYWMAPGHMPATWRRQQGKI
ncbi:hypothetical protein LTR78_006318 [Recurvomyces mirabilis]|uniref:2EXR domain-containing protein n=1 Tax=Recurvomyces mirabilis TaxID=574656 RepID=A0AAE0WL92_9PEZI|nr:hypothetical protein LTR78_006318 [Recurvomyces mirabilis]KAK5152207.1 hypothetical protein LTS14_008582 [Recurvomyces mirabilis]